MGPVVFILGVFMKSHLRKLSTRTASALFAFLLLVSGLTAGSSLVLSMAADATGTAATVMTEAELIAAAADPAVTTIGLGADIALSQKLVFSGRDVYIDGNNHTVTYTAGGAGWGSDYVFQAYKITFGTKNLAITGGDAALYVNGSTYTAQGTLDVSGNEFGGIEVSQGAGVTTPAVLNTTGATVINTTEAPARPTAWTDQSSVANAMVSGAFTKTTHGGTDQYHYYLNPAHAGIVVTNVTDGTTYASAQAAIDAATAGDTLRLDADILLAASGTPTIRLTKPLTFDGNGKTITAPFARGALGGQDNTAIAVVSAGVIVKDLSLVSTDPTNPAHGIVVDGRPAVVDGVVLQNITTNGATAGVIINGAAVTIDGIATSGSLWYGVGIDKGAALTIQGITSHTETIHLKNDDNTGSTLTDVAGRYLRTTSGGADFYVLGTETPPAPVIPVDPVERVLTPLTPAVFPAPVSPISAQQLGLPAGADTQDQARTKGAADTKGVATEKTVAQGVTEAEHKGLFLGVAWYWWVVGLAALALVAWWVVAAVRRRREEA